MKIRSSALWLSEDKGYLGGVDIIGLRSYHGRMFSLLWVAPGSRSVWNIKNNSLRINCKGGGGGLSLVSASPPSNCSGDAGYVRLLRLWSVLMAFVFFFSYALHESLQRQRRQMEPVRLHDSAGITGNYQFKKHGLCCKAALPWPRTSHPILPRVSMSAGPVQRVHAGYYPSTPGYRLQSDQCKAHE